MTQFHIPTRPYTPIDALNRRAAAVGSPGYAQATHYADYNGHSVSVSWNDYRGYYITQYWYAGRVVLCRGTFSECLKAAIAEFNRGALGCSVSVSPREDDLEAIELCQNSPELAAGKDDISTWHTWKHTAAAKSVRDYANPNALRLNFDWNLLQQAETEKEYEALLAERFGRAWTF